MGKRLRKLGQKPSFDQIKEEIIAIAAKYDEVDSQVEADIATLLNQTRNELKHYAGDEAIAFDLKADAEEMLERAFANYHLLTGVMLDEALEYWEKSRNA